MEHHANIVPWQLIAKEKNLQIYTVSVKDDGSLDLDELINTSLMKTLKFYRFAIFQILLALKTLLNPLLKKLMLGIFLLYWMVLRVLLIQSLISKILIVIFSHFLVTKFLDLWGLELFTEKKRFLKSSHHTKAVGI